MERDDDGKEEDSAAAATTAKTSPPPPPPAEIRSAKNGLISLFDPPTLPPPPPPPGPGPDPSYLYKDPNVDNKEDVEKKKKKTIAPRKIDSIDESGGGGGGSVAFQQAKSNSLDNTSVGSNDDNDAGVVGGSLFRQTKTGTPNNKKNKNKHSNYFLSCCRFFCTTTTPCLRNILPPDICDGPTIAGSFMFLLYHVVFALALASALTRPTQQQGGSPILGHMAKQTAVGIFVSCPFMITRLGNPDIPALYPSVDLFLAPFLAEAASIVDYQLCEEYKLSNPSTTTTGTAIVTRPDDEDDEEDGTTAAAASDHDDKSVDVADNDGGGGGKGGEECPYSKELFFGSFGVLTSIGMSIAGLALKLASLPNMKLANLGSYLPFSVLCGFFSAVGVLMWALAFNVDSGGHSWQQVFLSTAFTSQQKWDAVVHHLPSLMVGILMNRLGPKNPFYVVGLIAATIIVFYVTMALSGTSLEQAQHDGWFWSYNELATSKASSSLPPSTSWMLPPTPFGTWVSLLEGYVSWTAVFAGVKNMVALAFLYLLRSSIHASALKKNVNNLVRRIPVQKSPAADKRRSKLIRDQVTPILHANSGQPETRADESTSLLLEGGGRPGPTLDEEYDDDDDENDDYYSFEVGSVRRASTAAYQAASKMVTSVRDAVSIVNLSMKDDHELSPSKNCKAKLRTLPPGTTAPPGRRSQVSINSFSTDITTQRGYNSLTTPPRGGSTTGQVSDNSSVAGGVRDEKGEETERGTNLTRHHGNIDDDDDDYDGILVPVVAPTNYLASGADGDDGDNDNDGDDYIEIRSPPSKRTLEEVFVEYGNALWVVAAVGGFGCCPTVATSNTMYAIGAGSTTPQYGSVALLLIFYFTNFEIVRFIPKTAFSSLLVLGAVDTIVVWFYGPLKKTSSWAEWSVVPLIVAASLVVGFLNAVFIGIGISMFIFVGQFFTVGTVKYQASGLEIRSRIERSLIQSLWLDTNGDWIQVVVLQSYLFFGNATSLQQYISTMFDESFDVMTETQRLQFEIPPVPLVLVIDLSLVTGMDTSSVDCFDTIRQLCKSHNCKLHLCGLSPRMKKTLRLGGVRPDKKKRRRRAPQGGGRRGPSSMNNANMRDDDDDGRTLLFFQDLDSGLGKAEDYLIECEMTFSDTIEELSSLSCGIAPQQQPSGNSTGSTSTSSGFDRALRKIDELHGTVFSSKLKGLEQYAKVVKVNSGDFLYDDVGDGHGAVGSDDRGLFFIECGLLSIQHDSNDTTFGRSRTYMNSRSGSVDHQRHINSITNRKRQPRGEAQSNTTASRSCSSNSNSNSTGAGTTQDIARNYKLLNYNIDTLKGQHARLGTIAKRAALIKRLGGGGGGIGSYTNRHFFRYARVGAGWVLGMYEISQQQSVHRSESLHQHYNSCGGVIKCVQDGTTLYHVPFRMLQQLEMTDPILVVNLYKLLACVMSKKEDSTQNQLSMYHNIMTGNNVM